MFQVCLSAIISKMCWEPELPKKTFCFSSKQRDSCSKVNTLCKLKRDYFSLFPSHLHHHLEIKAWCRNQRRGLRRPHLPRWRAQSQGRCFWKRLSSRLLCGNFRVFSHICVGACVKAAGAEARRMTVCLWQSETQTLWSLLGDSCLPAVTVPLASYLASCPPLASFEDSYSGNWKLFSNKDEKKEENRHSEDKCSTGDDRGGNLGRFLIFFS